MHGPQLVMLALNDTWDVLSFQYAWQAIQSPGISVHIVTFAAKHL